MGYDWIFYGLCSWMGWGHILFYENDHPPVFYGFLEDDGVMILKC